MTPFEVLTGVALRRARRSQGLTLSDVATQSNGQFRASVLGGYERGERSISLTRFCALAQLYRVPPDRLLAEILAEREPAGRTKIVIDLTHLPELDKIEGRVVAAMARGVQARRGDYLSEVVSLRAGDIEALALQLRVEPDKLLSHLAPILQETAL